MSSPDIYDLISQLSSSKVKDRNESLVEIEQQIDTQVFTNKATNGLCNGLFAYIDNEKLAYMKNESPAGLSRIQSGSYVLRKLISKRASKFKPQLMLASIEFITTRFIDKRGRVFTPLALDLSRMLHALVSYDGHRGHILSDIWYTLVDSIINILRQHFRLNLTDQFIGELVESLNILLKNTTVSFSRISNKLSEMLCYYFNEIEKESSITQDLLETANQALLLMSTTDVNSGLQIVKSVVKAASRLAETKYEALKDQLLIFSIIASELMNNDIYRLVDHEGNQISILDASFREDLIRWLGISFQLIITNQFDSLNINMIQFKNNSEKTKTWFDFQTISAKDETSVKPWIKVFGLSCTLNSLYKIEEDSTEQASKRRRVDDNTFTSVLQNCDSSISVILHLISHSDHLVQALGLKLLVFQLHTVSVDKDNVSFDHILHYDKLHSSPWVSLAFKTLLEYGWEASNELLFQVLKININMLKDPRCVSIASQTIIQILSNERFIPNDRSLMQLVESVFESSEVNGPAIINNDSLKLWIVISELGKVLKFIDKSSGDKVIDWAISKWSSVDVHQSMSVLPQFIAWLSGSDFNHVDIENEFDNIFTRFHSRWEITSTLSRFILRNSSVAPGIVSHAKWKSSTPVLSFLSLDILLDKFLQTLQSLDEVGNAVILSKFIVYGHFIYQSTFHIAQLSSIAERIKYDIQRFLDVLGPRNSKEVLEVIANLNQLKLINQHGAFITDYINLDALISLSSATPERSVEIQSTPDDFSDFGIIRKASEQLDVETSFVYSDLRYCDTIEQQTVKLLLGLHNGFDMTNHTNSSIDQVLNFMEKLSAESYCSSFYTLLDYLEASNISNLRGSHIKLILRQFGAKLLGTYRFQNSPVALILLSRFSIICSKSLSIRCSEDIINDFSDIFNWFMTMAKKGSISEEYSQAQFLKALFHLLKDCKTLQIGELPDVYNTIQGLLTNSSNFVKVYTSSYVSAYLESSRWNQKLKFFQDYIGFFKSPENSSETAASFLLCLRNFSYYEYPFFMKSLTLIFSNYHYAHFALYSIDIFNQLIKSHNIPDSDQLSPIQLLELCTFWFRDRHDFVKFPYQLLGFETISEFIQTHAVMLLAITNSSRYCSSDAVKFIVLQRDQSDLEYKSIPMLIPLAFTSAGLRGDIHAQLLETYADIAVIEDFNLFLINWFIQLADVSSETEFFKHIPSLESSPNLKGLVSSTSDDLCCSLYIKIRLSDVLHEITKISKNEPTFWNPSLVIFLINELFKSLSEAFDSSEQLIVVRKLKLLVILGHWAFNSDDVILHFINTLSSFLSNKSLHYEVSNLIANILKMYPRNLIETDFYPSCLMKILYNLTLFKEDGNIVSTVFQDYLFQMFNEIKQNDQWRSHFSVFQAILSSQEIEMDLNGLTKIVKNSIKSSHHELKVAGFNLISLLLSKNPALAKIPPGFKTTKDVAQYLLTFTKRNKNHNSQVSVFSARYLARYYIETGDGLKTKGEEFERFSDAYIDDGINSFHFIFDELLRIKNESSDINHAIMINHVLGYAIHQYNIDPQLVDSSVDFGKYLAQFSKILVYFYPFTFNLLHPKMLIFGSIEEVISVSAFEKRSSTNWAQRICIGLLHELQEDEFLSNPLIRYLSIFPDISVKIMNMLWIHYAFSPNESRKTQILETFINNCLSCQNSRADPDNSKRKLVLNLVFLIRCCAKKKINPFRKLYPSLPLTTICQMATNLGLYKFSLLIFEEYFTSDYKNKLQLESFSHDITNIYEGLKDIDLLYGIPVQPSLDYAINIFNKTDEDPWKRVMFNSASFDSSMIYGNIPSSQTQLYQSLAANNLHGLSNLVNNDMNSLDKSSNIYDSFWKLNKWDIAAPKTPSNEGEIIYKILKTVKEQESYEKIQNVCEATMSDLLYCNDENLDLLKTLSIISSAESISSSSFIDYNQNISDYLESTEGWFKLVPFTSFENLILSRKILFENIRVKGSGGNSESLISECHELARYGKYARFHNERQKSINSSIQLDTLVKIVDTDDETKLLLSRLSNFESASTLWKQNETVIPVAMLNDNLNQKLKSSNIKVPLRAVELPDSVLHSRLVKWNSESKQKKFEQIMNDHVDSAIRYINEISTNQTKAEVYHDIAYFCYKQLKSSGFEEKIGASFKKLSSMQHQFQELSNLIKSKAISDKEKKNARTHAKKIRLQYDSDTELHNALIDNKKACIEKSIEFFLKTISIDDSFDDEDVDKFSALWLEFKNQNSVNHIISKEISNVPVYKFIPWINQLASHLASSQNDFQKNLQNVLLDMCIKHPFHSLYHIMNLRVQNSYEISRTDKAVGSRADAANEIWHKLATNSKELDAKVLGPIDDFVQQAIDLANNKIKGQSRKIYLPNLKIGEFWLNQLNTFDLPLPTMNNLPISLNCQYESLPRIAKVDPVVVISSSGISLPQIMTVILSNGSKHRLLLKGGSDDLRQDAIMEQVFEKVNKILFIDKESRKRELRIRTYKVVPLGPIAGMIEFVADSIALGDILRPLHSNDRIRFEEARNLMKEVQTKSTRERLATFNKIIQNVPPLFRNFFYENFFNVDDWYESRQIYSRGLATTSIVGHVLGLGDRHLNNILIDKKTGEPVHIDLGVAFDQGKLLPIPETVPFRLTRDLVDGLGVSGVKGSFAKASENVYRVLRSNAERIVGILNVLKHDPLYNWAISPVRKQKLQEIGENEKISDDSDDAGRAVDGVQEKLLGNGLSVEATVQQLIQEATDVENLAVIYLGWSPFY